MLARLFVVFAVVPVLELYVLIRVGKLIGAWETVAVLLAVSFAGAWLVRHQGFAILARIQGELAAGRLPAAELLDGFLVLVGGILLLTPGHLSHARRATCKVACNSAAIPARPVDNGRNRYARAASPPVFPRPRSSAIIS